MSTLIEIMDALAAQLRTELDAEIPGIQIEGRMNINPSPDPVALDIYPGDPFQEPDAFGLGENDIMLTIRARVNTPDSEGAQDALLALMDPKASTSVEQAVLVDPSLSSTVGNLKIETPPSNYGIFPDASGAAAFLGCTWTVRIIPGEGEPPVPSGFVIGSSYLNAKYVDATGIGSGVFTAPDLTLVDAEGSDFEIDGGDASVVNVLTDCWAEIHWNADAYPDSGGSVITDFTALLTVNAASIDAGTGFQPALAVAGWQQIMSEGIVELHEGDVIQFSVSASVDSGTWSHFSDGPVDVWLTRVQ